MATEGENGGSFSVSAVAYFRASTGDLFPGLFLSFDFLSDGENVYDPLNLGADFTDIIVVRSLIPEPASLALLVPSLVGVAGVASARHRRGQLVTQRFGGRLGCRRGGGFCVRLKRCG
jgi:hypothetical protein